MNKQMPMTVDRYTRADSISVGPGAGFRYNSTLVTVTSAEVDTAFLANHLNGQLKQDVCSSPDLAIFFKNGVTIGYYYRASDGGFVGSIDITPKDCGFPI